MDSQIKSQFKTNNQTFKHNRNFLKINLKNQSQLLNSQTNRIQNKKSIKSRIQMHLLSQTLKNNKLNQNQQSI